MSQDMTTADIAGRQHEAPAPPTEPVDDGRTAAVPDTPTQGEARPETPAPRSALLESTESDRFQGRWREIQTHFVDAPQEAVQDADTLVAELMQHLAETFANERATLEQQWVRGEDVSTEDLRVALTRYRSFFERLLEA
jgi:hypothetical protein